MRLSRLRIGFRSGVVWATICGIFWGIIYVGCSWKNFIGFFIGSWNFCVRLELKILNRWWVGLIYFDVFVYFKGIWCIDFMFIFINNDFRYSVMGVRYIKMIFSWMIWICLFFGNIFVVGLGDFESVFDVGTLIFFFF